MSVNKFDNVGIGIISYNRSDFLSNCLDSVYSSSLHGAEVAVFDDCSSDTSYDVAKRYGKAFRPKKNGGVVRNKNRALFYFSEVSPKKTIILLEDDTIVSRTDWLDDWVGATLKYGHINYSHPDYQSDALKENYVSGLGTIESPHIYKLVTGQCSGIDSGLVKNTVGYLDPSFEGFGYGHVEWTMRLVQKNLGGFFKDGRAHFMSIPGGIVAPPAPSFRNVEQLDRNASIFTNLSKQGFSNRIEKPWLDEEEKLTHFILPFSPSEVAESLEKGAKDQSIVQSPLSAKEEKPADLEKPKMTFPDEVASFVQDCYTTKLNILEYGSGGSTAFAAEQVGRTVFSIESDLEWVRMMQRWFLHEPPKGSIQLHHVNIGPTKEWGLPKDTSRLLHYIDYPMSVWQRPDLVHPDVVLIDGRFRVACFVATLMHIRRPTTILFDDYTDRPHYHIVEELLAPAKTVGRMAVFEAKPRALHPSEWHRFGAYFFRPE